MLYSIDTVGLVCYGVMSALINSTVKVQIVVVGDAVSVGIILYSLYYLK